MMMWLPAVVLVAAGIATSAGLAMTPANAANVTVSAVVGGTVSLDTASCTPNANPATQLDDITAGDAGYESADCVLTFGSTNTDNVEVLVAETGGSANSAFFELGGNDNATNIPDFAACAASFAAPWTNNGGMTVNSTGANVTNVSSCGTNGQWEAVPGTADNFCRGDGGAMNATAYTCTLRWGIEQNVTTSTPGTYSGDAAITAAAW